MFKLAKTIRKLKRVRKLNEICNNIEYQSTYQIGYLQRYFSCKLSLYYKNKEKYENKIKNMEEIVRNIFYDDGNNLIHATQHLKEKIVINIDALTKWKERKIYEGELKILIRYPTNGENFHYLFIRGKEEICFSSSIQNKEEALKEYLTTLIETTTNFSFGDDECYFYNGRIYGKRSSVENNN